MTFVQVPPDKWQNIFKGYFDCKKDCKKLLYIYISFFILYLFLQFEISVATDYKYCSILDSLLLISSKSNHERSALLTKIITIGSF